MNDDKNNVVPIIVNGKLNDGKYNKPKKNHQDKLPSKRFNFIDVLLTLLGIFLIGYGVYGIITKDKNKEEDIISDSNTSSNSSEVTNQNSNIDVSKYITFNTKESYNIFTPEDINLINSGAKASDMSLNFKLSVAARQAKKYTSNSNEYILQSDLQESIKNIFGDISITNASFSYGDNIYVYNQETKRYYLLDNSNKINLDYTMYHYIKQEEVDNKLIIKYYIAYTDTNKTRSWTLNNISLTDVIDSNNIKDKFNNLKYIEYQFNKVYDKYYLDTITIK